MGATYRAGIGLSMKTAVQRILIFLAALRTHREICHRSLGPVIGNVFNNGKTRPAVGAVGKGISITPVGRVPDLSLAIFADSDIRGNHSSLSTFFGAGMNGKFLKALESYILYGATANHSQGWWVIHQTAGKCLHLILIAFNFYIHSGGSVKHPPLQAILGG